MDNPAGQIGRDAQPARSVTRAGELDSASADINAAATESVAHASAARPSTPPCTGLQGWTLMFISAGIGLIACCILIPQADENRRLRHEAQKLQGDLDYLDRQIAVNAEFIRRLDTDPAVAERLAQRQLRFVREGTQVLELEDRPQMVDRSPFALLTVPPPLPMPAMYVPGGRLASLCREPRKRLYLMGAGLMMLAMGLVLGPTDGPRVSGLPSVNENPVM